MDGLYFLLSIVAVGIVMWWVWQNDRVPPDQPTRGLLAMRFATEMARYRRLKGWLSSTGDTAAAPRRRRRP
jgi:hypothetical protein